MIKFYVKQSPRRYMVFMSRCEQNRHLDEDKIMAKRTRFIKIALIIAFCLVMVPAYFKLFNKPFKEDLLPAINEAFEYYRKGSECRPAVCVYFLEYPEEFVTYEPLPAELDIPDFITADSFTLKRPSRYVIARIPLDGYIACCKLEYLGPYFMESYPPPAWQVVTVEFHAAE